MDPSIVKLLEEDEDESMHSGADVDAFQAALNRDIEGSISASQPPGTNTGSDHSSSRPFTTWNNGSGDSDPNLHRQHGLGSSQIKEHQGSSLDNQKQNELERNQPQEHRQLWEKPSQIPQTGFQISEKNPLNEQERPQNQESESQYMKLQKMSSQQARIEQQQQQQQQQQPVNPTNRGPRQVPFAILLPTLVAQLDKDRAMQLHTLYAKLKRNEIPKDGFTRHMKDIVGDQMLRLAVSKMQQMNNNNQGKIGIQAPIRPSHPEISGQKSQTDARGIHGNQMASSTSSTSNSVQGLNKLPHQLMQQQQQQQVPSNSFPIYGTSSSTYSSFPPPSSIRPVGSTSPNMMTMPNRIPTGGNPSLSHFPTNPSSPWQGSSTNKEPTPGMSNVKQESVDQSSGSVENQGVSKDDCEKLSSRMSLPTSSNMMHTNSVSSSPTTQLDSTSTLNSRAPPGSSPAGVNVKTLPRKPAIGQKKTLDPLGSSPPSKKQKVTGTNMDQSIEQLNDVTAVSGVNLREEEEQLFSVPKEYSRASEASRRAVQEEEDKLIIQKIPLQKKLAEIMAKWGLKHISSDIERCLSLCVEERMRGLISNIIRLSKQRVDAEKSRHRTVITSDIRQQINEMNQKVKEKWEKTLAEAEKLKKSNEPEGDDGGDSEKDKDDNRSKLPKVNREEDDKMRTTAANVAARAAVGGDDMASRWQMMAEQARQKREGGSDATSSSLSGNPQSTSALGRNSKDGPEGGRRAFSSGGSRKGGKNQGKVVRKITVKDVISVLEREPQMSKSTLLFCLHNQVQPHDDP